MNEIYQIPVLIPIEYLSEYSVLPKNFDYTDIKPFIPIAESVWIIDILGRPLYDELIDEVINNEVTDVNSTLLLKVYQLEAQCVVYEALPFIWSHLTEKGITLGKSDNSDSISAKDLSSVQNHLRAQITVLQKILKDFLEEHKDCYPLYVTIHDCCNPHTKGERRLYSNNRRKNNHNF